MVQPLKSVVVVEDEPETAEMFAEMVRLTGYQVYKASNGVRGMDLIREKMPVAVLLDLMMPDLSGMGVLRLLRRDPRLSKIPVIIVSAKGLPADIQEGLKAGAVSYLTKPVAFAELKRVLTQIIAGPADPSVL